MRITREAIPRFWDIRPGAYWSGAWCVAPFLFAYVKTARHQKWCHVPLAIRAGVRLALEVLVYLYYLRVQMSVALRPQRPLCVSSCLLFLCFKLSKVLHKGGKFLSCEAVGQSSSRVNSLRLASSSCWHVLHVDELHNFIKKSGY